MIESRIDIGVNLSIVIISYMIGLIIIEAIRKNKK